MGWRAGLWLVALALAPVPVCAGMPLVAARTLPAGAIIGPGDVTILPPAEAGQGPFQPPASDLEAVVGLQTRTTIYEGRAVQPANLTRPILVERNALVAVNYVSGSLSISTEGRALGRGGAGDTVPVLNIASRVTLTARINPDGTLSVITSE